MPTKSLERLMFVQGGLCFFCKQPLSKADASVEHLLASANAGNNHDDNCVACCKSFNALLGSMSLKEHSRRSRVRSLLCFQRVFLKLT